MEHTKAINGFYMWGRIAEKITEIGCKMKNIKAEETKSV
jgi:hypothetical protein